jgi:hypothetical protein
MAKCGRRMAAGSGWSMPDFLIATHVSYSPKRMCEVVQFQERKADVFSIVPLPETSSPRAHIQ